MAAIICVQMQSGEVINQQKEGVALLQHNDGVFDIEYMGSVPVCDRIYTTLHHNMYNLYANWLNIVIDMN